MTRLPAAARRDVPGESSPGYIAHHGAVYADPRVTDLAPAVRYFGEYSTDNGATWKPVPLSPGWGSVCGGHVQHEAASALLCGWDVVADGTTRIVRHWNGDLSRWTTT